MNVSIKSILGEVMKKTPVFTTVLGCMLAANCVLAQNNIDHLGICFETVDERFHVIREPCCPGPTFPEPRLPGPKLPRPKPGPTDPCPEPRWSEPRWDI